MRYEHIPCGPFVNESEILAFRKLSGVINQREGSSEVFRILTNLQFALTSQAVPDDLDVLVCGPSGFHVIEIKHWDIAYLKENSLVVEAEADKLNQKVRKVATLRTRLPFIPFLSGKFLLTKCNEVPEQMRRVRGAGFYGLRQCAELLELGELGKLTDDQTRRLASSLWPYAKPPLDNELKRIGPSNSLSRLSGPEERFHRVYQGLHSSQRDRIILHLYDLSATDAKNSLEKARRAYLVLQRYQKSPYLPRLVDSFQELREYPGVMYFFTHADEAAPVLREVSSLSNWTVDQRLDFASKALSALDELHNSGEGEGLLHRGINPNTLLVRADNRPLFAGWEWAKLPDTVTISTTTPANPDPFIAPEVCHEGLAAADRRSDVFAISATLATAFEPIGDARARRALEVLRGGIESQPELRPSLAELGHAFATIPTAPAVALEPPISRWSDDFQVEMFQGLYRVVSRLSGGSLGFAFKVVKLSEENGAYTDTVVAKGSDDPDGGLRMLKAYERVKTHTGRPGLSWVIEVAREWQPTKPVALLEWLEGESLGYWAGLLAEYAAELGEATPEELLLGWLEEICAGLARLHTARLVHGDISPNNIIVNRAAVWLTDYDLVTQVGQAVGGRGTPPYSSLRVRRGEPVSPADDLYALAATFFYALTARDPFMYNGVHHEERGLAWEGSDREQFPQIAHFLDRVAGGAFPSAAEALEALRILKQPLSSTSDEFVKEVAPAVLKPNHVEWLQQILKAYPGSPRWGNVETRGLDSEFARDTYVSTQLDESLYELVMGSASALVILCGNAGDGKTSILQHLAGRLGISSDSATRVWEAKLPNGTTVKANLDGAAAWKDRSADELLDELFEPFQHGAPEQRLVHLIAANDGRLLEWISHYEGRVHITALTEALAHALGDPAPDLPSHIHFIDLNARSLVGTISLEKSEAQSSLINELLDKMVGGEAAAQIWAPCKTCSAQERCLAWDSARVLAQLEDGLQAANLQLRSRLVRMFQAVHQRDEVHITARSLKAALSYILFGVHYCSDLHDDPTFTPASYYDLAFDADSVARQGELLGELACLDPALGASPRSDRYLISQAPSDPAHEAPRYAELSLARARRCAYFEWSEEQIAALNDGADKVDLARGAHFETFLLFPTLSAEEQTRVRAKLCRGISQLGSLPRVALDRGQRAGVVPVGIIQRMPTETVFWIEKPLARFELREETFRTHPRVDCLHRKLILTYRSEEHEPQQLDIPFELFARLMDLNDGVQLSDVASDAIFANLSVFTERLARESERSVFAWNPLKEDTVCEVSIGRQAGRQVLTFAGIDNG